MWPEWTRMMKNWNIWLSCFFSLILFKNFDIIWAFTAFRVINSNEMAWFLVWLKKSQKCHRNHMFIVNITSDIWNLGWFWSIFVKLIFISKRCNFLAIYLSESFKIPDDSKHLKKMFPSSEKNDFIYFLIKFHFIDFLSRLCL